MAMDRRKIYGIKSKFNYVVDVILESIEKAYSTLEEFSECGVAEIEQQVETVQGIIAGCCKATLEQVDSEVAGSAGNGLTKLGDFFPTEGMTEIKHDGVKQTERPDGVIVPDLPPSDRQEDLEIEAEEEIKKLYQEENDALLKIEESKEEEKGKKKEYESAMEGMEEQEARMREEELKQEKEQEVKK